MSTPYLLLAVPAALAATYGLRRAYRKLPPRRHQDGPPAPAPATVRHTPESLRLARTSALRVIAALVAAASAASFTQSYRGLWLWARHHGLSGLWAALFPAQLDVFIAVGELALFVALVDRWDRRSRVGAWCVTLTGLAVSVAGNVGHIAGDSVTNRASAAVPPIAAASALAVGLGVLKRVVRSAAQSAPSDVPVISADGPPVPTVAPDAESAALAAYIASIKGGNPLSARQMETRFGLSRSAVAKVRQQVVAEANGHAREPGELAEGDDNHGTAHTEAEGATDNQRRADG